ncbi:ribonuclease H2 subunit C [Ricinus communis]|uniref:Phosphatidylinositol n-acetylglucosaminyltransferase subunit p, putative n=1 Tax=Ricinus communis TaxID=3988 RepID=B9SWR4_RICCO|nr:ribonuclease H2 subunit C [Ricinus communis]EEF31943.1 phosphatidylinositol n-acetylglucosaminyltransferase subunit p, putative [Ricinus communis]|eukprot:XP_002530433.1 ribonuclease H2 subunit C [Ricinus communis]
MEEEGNLEAGTMGIINLTKNQDEVTNLSGQIHRLPCCIKYDGPCAVSHYFKPNPTGVESEGLIIEESYFRGRKLQGATVPLPPGYSGFVIGKKKNKCFQENENSNCWEMNAKFENVTYWNLDTLPSLDDTFSRSFHWLSVAQALHKPVTAEDLASASITLEKK